MRDKNKRLRKDSPDMKSLKEYHGIDPQGDYNEPLDAKFMIDVATSDDPYGTPFILFDGDKKYSAYIYFMARGWVHIDENDNIEIGRHKIHIQDMAIGKYDSDQVKDGTWLDNLSDIDEKVIDDKFLDGLKTEDGRTLKQACEDILAEIVHTNYESGDYNLEYAEEDGENYIDFFFNTYTNDESLEESANKSETKLTESRDSWTVTDTYEVENPSAERRISEARARGAKRFYEWDASKDRAWLRAHDKYLDRLAGDLNKPYDDSLEDKYDKVWVHGYTENVPLVVFEGDKKYLASYEYEVTGKIDANAEEVFQLTDTFEFISFDLYDFPKAGVIPADWNEKNDVIVASISDDKERLAGITVADGTPVVKALEDQMIRGVEREYFDGDVEEHYSDDYDPDYDDIELEVDLVYKGELNKRPSRDMNESAKKLRDRIKESSKRRRMREDLEWSTIYTYEVENDDPVIVRSGDGVEYECNFGLECTADYDCDTYGVTGELRDYKIDGISFEDAKDMSSYMDFSEEEINEPRVQAILKDFTVVDVDEEMPLLQYIAKFAEESVEDFAEEAEENLDYDDYYDPSVDYDPPRD